MTAEIIQPTSPRIWYEIWWDVWIHPGAVAFQGVINEPGMSLKRVIIWVGTTDLLAAIFPSFILIAVPNNTFSQFYSGNILILIRDLLLAPIHGILLILISTILVHGIAKLFRGHGKWRDLVYTFSCIYPPYSILMGIVGILLTVLSSAGAVYWLPIIMIWIMLIYILKLFILAVRTVEKSSAGQAIGTTIVFTMIIGIIFLFFQLSLFQFGINRIISR